MTHNKFKSMNKFFTRWYWTDFWYRKIDCKICPRQKWLTDLIPNTWMDKDGLIEIILLKMVEEYVESEIGKGKLFDSKRWSGKYKEYCATQIKFEKELKNIYFLTTVKLPDLEKQLELAMDKIPFRGLDEINNAKKGDYKIIYGEYDKLKKQICNLKTKILTWVVLNRGSMWT